MNELKILTLFQSNKKEKAFQALYKIMPQFMGYVKSQGGSKEHAEDIFQEAILVVYKKLADQNFEFEGSRSNLLTNTSSMSTNVLVMVLSWQLHF